MVLMKNKKKIIIKYSLLTRVCVHVISKGKGMKKIYDMLPVM